MFSNFGHTSSPSFFLFVERLSSPFQLHFRYHFQYHGTHQSPWSLLPSYQPLGIEFVRVEKKRERESRRIFHPMGGGCSLETKTMLNFTVDIPIPNGWWVTVTITKIWNRCRIQQLEVLTIRMVILPNGAQSLTNHCRVSLFATTSTETSEKDESSQQ